MSEVELVKVLSPAEPRMVKFMIEGRRGVKGDDGADGEAGGGVTWSTLSGKPSTFPPSTHSHPTSQITGLDAILAGISTALGEAVTDDDPRLSDARTPTAHTHPWSEVTGKPSTFAPSTHSHAISDTTGLQSALDGKADDADLAAKQDAATAATDAELTAGLAQKADTSELQDETDARVAADDTLSTAISARQPLDADLTAIAALSTTSYGRALLALADAAAGRTALGLGTAATHAHGDYEAAGAAAAAQAASQPLDSDLTAIAALSTTSYGRSLLALADAAAGRTSLGLGDSATKNVGTSSGTVAAGDDSRITQIATSGKGYVNHGATAGTARPSGYASIEWVGSVEPSNAVNGDTWVNTA